MILMQLEAIRHTILFLDTNLILGYLFEEDPEHEATRTLIDACKGFSRVCVSRATIDEFRRQIDWAKSTLLSRDVPAVARLHPVVATFLEHKRHQSNLDPRAFLSPYEDGSSYFQHMGIEVDVEGNDDFTADTNYSLVWRTIREIRSPIASDNVITHDATNLVMIHTLRNIHHDTALGPAVWLVTRDASLRKAEVRLKDKFEIPHCRTVTELNAWLIPIELEKANLDVQDFVVFLIQSELGAATKLLDLDTELMDLMRNPRLEISRIFELPPDLVIKMLAQLQSSEDAKRLFASLASEDERVADEADEALTRIALDYLMDEAVTKERETEDLKRRLRQARSDNSQLRQADLERAALFESVKARVEQLERTQETVPRRSIWRWLLGLLNRSH
jgi:hypothetical protein